MKHSNTINREDSRFFKPLVKSLSMAMGLVLWASAWAVVDRVDGSGRL